MEAKMKKTCLLVAILVLVFCNSMNPSRAMLMETNSSFSIIGDDNELEFLMDSHSSRILRGGRRYVTLNIGRAGKAAVNCGRYKNYQSCLPKRNRAIVQEKCGIYKRRC
ncbi:hypothetical protein PTKIN_Ptkin12aG0020700 [Pterospermum kingtungense]